MRDAIARIAERDGRARHGAQLAAGAGERRVERRDEAAATAAGTPARRPAPPRRGRSRRTTRNGWPGVIQATGSRVRTAAPGSARVSAAGSWPMPPRRPRKAPSPSGAPARAASAASTLPPAASASASGGKSARSDRRSTSPAWMPPSSGWAIRRVNASPKRRVVKAPTDSSSTPAGGAGASKSRATRARSSSGEHRQAVGRRARQRQAEPRVGREGVQPAVGQDERGARRLGRDDLVGQSELAAQRERGRLLHQHRVRAALDQHAVDVLGADDAAEARSRPRARAASGRGGGCRAPASGRRARRRPRRRRRRWTRRRRPRALVSWRGTRARTGRAPGRARAASRAGCRGRG